MGRCTSVDDQAVKSHQKPWEGTQLPLKWRMRCSCGPLDFLSSCGMIIRVLKDNWKVEFEGDHGTLGDSASTAVKELIRGYDKCFSHSF